jgi:glycosyltransferase involved in cell wall biosynthesis
MQSTQKITEQQQQLLHVQTSTYIEPEKNPSTSYTDQSNEHIPPDLDVSAVEPIIESTGVLDSPDPPELMLKNFDQVETSDIDINLNVNEAGLGMESVLDVVIPDQHLKPDNNLNLTILQPLRAKLLPDGQVLLTRKLIEAVQKFDRLWSGSITLLMEETNQEHDNLDGQIFNLNELPFNLQIVDFKKINPAELRTQTSLVLATLGYRQNHISKICKEAGIPCIYVSEYSLKTRKQIVAVETKNPLRRLRKNLWEQTQEWKQRNAIALADGLQCNGTPTYDAYRKINGDPLLFFDTRVTEDMLATKEDIEKRTRELEDNMPLRLVFSGRLNRMKGADHLLDVATELRRMGIPFQLSISGAGELEKSMHQRIAADGLGDCVKMMGVPNFKTEFFPFVKAKTDLFICCHRQGDPSCTYTETMSCGVPIVGYANEAFMGIVEHSQAGWLVEMDQPKLLARKVAELSRNREEIKAMSFNSLNFAREHTFDKTFEARIKHMKRIARKRESCRQGV